MPARVQHADKYCTATSQSSRQRKRLRLSCAPPLYRASMRASWMSSSPHAQLPSSSCGTTSKTSWTRPSSLVVMAAVHTRSGSARSAPTMSLSRPFRSRQLICRQGGEWSGGQSAAGVQVQAGVQPGLRRNARQMHTP
jgi:hypothetical protein